MTARVNANPIKFTSSPIYLRFDEVELRMLDPTESELETVETEPGLQFMLIGVTAGIVFITSISIFAIIYFINKK